MTPLALGARASSGPEPHPRAPTYSPPVPLLALVFSGGSGSQLLSCLYFSGQTRLRVLGTDLCHICPSSSLAPTLALGPLNMEGDAGAGLLSAPLDSLLS